MSVPQLNIFLTTLNNREIVLLSELKTLLTKSIDFYSSNYIQDTSSIDDYELKCKNILSGGYEYFFKINTILEILHITDSSQTNKYKYEESLGFIPNMNTFLDSIYNIYINKYELDIQKYISLSSIEKNAPSFAEKYIDAIELKKSMLFVEKINIFNHHINQNILLLIKITKNLKNTNIN